MPWCDQCDRLVEDEELTEEGNCPECGDLLTGRRPIPWPFKFMLVATVIYLGYRTYQLATLIAHHV
jgi:hypothetical protein